MQTMSTHTLKTPTKIYCAVDTPDIERALELASYMAKAQCGIKLGLEFFNAQGPNGIDKIRQNYPDLPLFIDLKYHDIPNTVAGAVRSISRLEPDYINIHALGGEDMMIAAKGALESNTTKLLAVTILTSMSETDLGSVGIEGPLTNRVSSLAKLTAKTGLDGIVCSAAELEALKPQLPHNFIFMVPGIRPVGSNANDQQRIMTPHDALKKGATHLVIGRPITQHSNPEQAANDILNTL
jgi:orotidine-5'-phosphate decarboxylase